MKKPPPHFLDGLVWELLGVLVVYCAVLGGGLAVVWIAAVVLHG